MAKFSTASIFPNAAVLMTLMMLLSLTQYFLTFTVAGAVGSPAGAVGLPSQDEFEKNPTPADNNGRKKIKKLIVSENDGNPLTQVQRLDLQKSCPGVVRVQKVDILNFDIVHMEEKMETVECATDWLHQFQKTGQVNFVADDEEMKPAMMLKSAADEKSVAAKKGPTAENGPAAGKGLAAEKTSKRSLSQSNRSALPTKRTESPSRRSLASQAGESAEDGEPAEEEEEAVFIPDDPYFDDQWALKADGDLPGDRPSKDKDADLQAAEAFALLRDIVLNSGPFGPDGWGSSPNYFSPTGGGTLFPPPIIVAVFDSGVRYDHEDLADQMWTNINEIPNNGLDDDGNGYVDDIHGIDVANNDGDPMDDEYDTKFGHPGHGTHVAGIIAANANNGVGITGIAGGTLGGKGALGFRAVQIMAIKIGSFADCIEGIAYALKHGAKISNWSVGSSSFGQSSSSFESENDENFGGAENDKGFDKKLEIWRAIFSKILRFDPDHIAIAAAGNDDISMAHKKEEEQSDEDRLNEIMANRPGMKRESAQELLDWLKMLENDGDEENDDNDNDNANNGDEENNLDEEAKSPPSLPCGVGIEYSVLCVTATNRWDKLGQNANKGAEIVHLAAPGDDILSTHIYDDRRKTPAEFRRLYKQGPIFNHPLEKEVLNYDRGFLGDVSSAGSGSSGSGSFLGMGAAKSGQTALPWAEEVITQENSGKKQKRFSVGKSLQHPKSLTSKKTSYRSLSGSSFAAPQVTGLAVLLKVARPFLSGQELLKGAILEHADQIPDKISDVDVEKSRRLNFLKPLKAIYDKYPDPPSRPETLVKRIENMTPDANPNPGVITTLLQMTIEYPKCNLQMSHMVAPGEYASLDMAAGDRSDEEFVREKADILKQSQDKLAKSDDLAKEEYADLVKSVSLQLPDFAHVAKTRRVDFEEEVPKSSMFRDFKENHYFRPRKAKQARLEKHEDYDPWRQDEKLYYDWNVGQYDPKQYYKRPGEVQIWFLDFDKQRIGAGPLETERIWDPEELLKLGVDRKILPRNDNERYVKMYDRWDPYAKNPLEAADSAEFDRWDVHLVISEHNEERRSRVKERTQAYDAPSQIPFFLYLKDQPVPPEAQYIAAFTAYIDMEQRHCVDDVSCPEGTAFIPFSVHNPQYLTAGSVIKLKDDSKAWRQDKEEEKKVRIEQKWQNFDATYSYTKKDASWASNENSEISEKENQNDFLGENGGENVEGPEKSSENSENSIVSVDDRKFPFLYYVNVDRVISFLPPAAGESEITHYNIYKGQWMPCSEKKPVTVKQRKKEVKAYNDNQQNGEENEDGSEDSKSAKVCWGFCVPREVEQCPAERGKPRFFEQKFCSQHAREKEGGYRCNYEERLSDDKVFNTRYKYQERAFLKSVPAMGYLNPYCTSSLLLLSNPEDSESLNPKDQQVGQEIQKDSCSQLVKLETKTINTDIESFKQADIKNKNAEERAKNADLWERYGPSIHTTTRISYDSALVDLQKDKDSPKAEDGSPEAEDGSTQNNEHFWITVTGPGILTVEELNLPSPSDINSAALGVETVLSYKGFKFAGSYDSASEKKSPYPDMVVPAGKHYIEWTKRVTDPELVKKNAFPNAEEKARLKFTLNFHSTARYENIHVHVPDINLKSGPSDPAVPERLANGPVADIFRNPEHEFENPDKEFIPSSIIIVPAFRKQNGVFGSVEANLHAANAIDIDPPPPLGPSTRLIEVDKSEIEDSASEESFESFDEEKSEESQPEESQQGGVVSKKSEWKQKIPNTYKIEVPRLYHFSEKMELEKLYKPEAVQFLDTNPEPNAFSGKVRIVAARESLEVSVIQAGWSSASKRNFASEAEKKGLRRRRGHFFCPWDGVYRWEDNVYDLENVEGKKSKLYSPSPEIELGDAEGPVGKDCAYRVRLSASLHWYDDLHADESLSGLWRKERKRISRDADAGDADLNPDADAADSKDVEGHYVTEWVPNSPREQKKWNGHYWQTRLLEPQESALTFGKYDGDQVLKFSNEGFLQSDASKKQFPYPSSWQKSSGILWEGSCYAIIPHDGYYYDGYDRIEVEKPDEISCEIDMEPVKLAGARSKKPMKWRLLANERTVPTDVVHMPTVSTLIVPVYDVAAPPSPGTGFFPPSLGLDFYRGQPGSSMDLIQEFEKQGANQWKNANQWDVLNVNMANVVGRHSVGLTGFRLYWENENFMSLENTILHQNENNNANSDAIARKLQKKENFIAEAALPLVCPPTFSNADVIENEQNYWKGVSETENSESRFSSLPIDDNRRFATSPGFPGCEVLGPFAPRCYSSDVYPFGSPFDSCSNGGWEITHLDPQKERKNFEEKDANKPPEDKLTYRLKKTIKHQYEDEFIYFPTKGRMVLRDFKINGLKWGSPYLTLRDRFPFYGNVIFGQHSNILAQGMPFAA